MKVKRILSLILSLTLMLTGCISVSLAEEPEAEDPLESDNELSVIMDEEIEIVQAEALLSAAPAEEPEEDDYSYEDAAEDLQALETSPLYGMVDNEEIANLCSKYKIEVQSWLKIATEVMETEEMQVA
jgi:hypothetical protein